LGKGVTKSDVTAKPESGEKLGVRTKKLKKGPRMV